MADNRGTREFISVLMLFRDFPAADVYAAVELALELGIRSCAGVRQILVASHQEPSPQAPLPHWPALPPPDLASYAVLGGVA